MVGKTLKSVTASRRSNRGKGSATTTRILALFFFVMAITLSASIYGTLHVATTHSSSFETVVRANDEVTSAVEASTKTDQGTAAQASPSDATRVLSSKYSKVWSSSNLPDTRAVSCRRLLQDYDSGNITDKNEGQAHFRHTITSPPFWIALHNPEVDHVRYNIMGKGDYYESVLTSAIQSILQTKEPGETVVVDVGGNIGWFSLVAASMNHAVAMFEPNTVNIIKMCQSLHMNNMIDPGYVHVYQNGVGSTHGQILPLHTRSAGANSGVGRFSELDDNNPNAVLAEKGVELVTLDKYAEERGWFERKLSIAVLKVDVEGYEAHVFAGAHRLLTEGFVENIFMEFRDQVDVIRPILDAGYDVYKLGRFKGPAREYPKDIPRKDIPDELVTRCKQGRSGACNLWWKRTQNTPDR